MIKLPKVNVTKARIYFSLLLCIVFGMNTALLTHAQEKYYFNSPIACKIALSSHGINNKKCIYADAGKYFYIINNKNHQSPSVFVSIDGIAQENKNNIAINDNSTARIAFNNVGLDSILCIQISNNVICSNKNSLNNLSNSQELGVSFVKNGNEGGTLLLKPSFIQKKIRGSITAWIQGKGNSTKFTLNKRKTSSRSRSGGAGGSGLQGSRVVVRVSQIEFTDNHNIVFDNRSTLDIEFTNIGVDEILCFYNGKKEYCNKENTLKSLLLRNKIGLHTIGTTQKVSLRQSVITGLPKKITLGFQGKKSTQFTLIREGIVINNSIPKDDTLAKKQEVEVSIDGIIQEGEDIRFFDNPLINVTFKNAQPTDRLCIEIVLGKSACPQVNSLSSLGFTLDDNGNYTKTISESYQRNMGEGRAIAISLGDNNGNQIAGTRFELTNAGEGLYAKQRREKIEESVKNAKQVRERSDERLNAKLNTILLKKINSDNIDHYNSNNNFKMTINEQLILLVPGESSNVLCYHYYQKGTQWKGAKSSFCDKKFTLGKLSNGKFTTEEFRYNDSVYNIKYWHIVIEKKYIKEALIGGSKDLVFNIAGEKITSTVDVTPLAYGQIADGVVEPTSGSSYTKTQAYWCNEGEDSSKIAYLNICAKNNKRTPLYKQEIAIFNESGKILRTLSGQEITGLKNGKGFRIPKNQIPVGKYKIAIYKMRTELKGIMNSESITDEKSFLGNQQSKQIEYAGGVSFTIHSHESKALNLALSSLNKKSQNISNSGNGNPHILLGQRFYRIQKHMGSMLAGIQSADYRGTTHLENYEGNKQLYHASVSKSEIIYLGGTLNKYSHLCFYKDSSNHSHYKKGKRMEPYTLNTNNEQVGCEKINTFVEYDNNGFPYITLRQDYIKNGRYAIILTSQPKNSEFRDSIFSSECKRGELDKKVGSNFVCKPSVALSNKTINFALYVSVIDDDKTITPEGLKAENRTLPIPKNPTVLLGRRFSAINMHSFRSYVFAYGYTILMTTEGQTDTTNLGKFSNGVQKYTQDKEQGDILRGEKIYLYGTWNDSQKICFFDAETQAKILCRPTKSFIQQDSGEASIILPDEIKSGKFAIAIVNNSSDGFTLPPIGKTCKLGMHFESNPQLNKLPICKPTKGNFALIIQVK